MRATEAQQRIEKLDEFISHAWAVINTMVEDQGNPEALDRHWREASNNDVTLKLAQAALSRESQAPFIGDTARRIGEGLWGAKMEAGRALLRTKVMAGATTRAARA